MLITLDNGNKAFVVQANLNSCTTLTNRILNFSSLEKKDGKLILKTIDDHKILGIVPLTITNSTDNYILDDTYEFEYFDSKTLIATHMPDGSSIQKCNKVISGSIVININQLDIYIQASSYLIRVLEGSIFEGSEISTQELKIYKNQFNSLPEKMETEKYIQRYHGNVNTYTNDVVLSIEDLLNNANIYITFYNGL